MFSWTVSFCKSDFRGLIKKNLFLKTQISDAGAIIHHSKNVNRPPYTSFI